MSTHTENLQFNTSTTLARNAKLTWTQLIDEQAKNNKLKGATCALYSNRGEDGIDQNALCLCGRLKSRHSFTGKPTEKHKKYRDAKKWTTKCSEEVDLTEYGQMDNGARFIRCDTEGDTFEILADIVAKDVGNHPKLFVSCYGGAEYFTMTDELEREFMNGIGQIAGTQDVWILTTGLNSGVSKLIGQGVHRHILLNESTWKPVVIGMSRWGTIPEDTRRQLKQQKPVDETSVLPQSTSLLTEGATHTLDNHHTHFLLLDNGDLGQGQYLDDRPRSKFVEMTCKKTSCHAVTIIVDGGSNTLEVIQNDLSASPPRPVIIVHKSGRLANVLGNLLEIAGVAGSIGENEVTQQLKDYPVLVPVGADNQKAFINSIIEVLQLKNRQYLSIFQLGYDVSVTNTIFRAVFNPQLDANNPKNLLKLAVNWNCVDGAHDLFKKMKEVRDTSSTDVSQDIDRNHYPRLFKEALIENRPQFVDYFLRRYYNPLKTVEFVKYRATGTRSLEEENKMCVAYALQFTLEHLYNKFNRNPVEKYPRPSTLTELDQLYSKLIGPYIQSLYRHESTFNRFKSGFSSLCSLPNWIRLKKSRVGQANETLKQVVTNVLLPSLTHQQLQERYHSDKIFGQQEMLRDIFLWSVYEGYADISFVLLLQLKSRISAALVAVRMTHRLASTQHNPYIRTTYKEHGTTYEMYATACIDACYEHSEKRACQLLLREIPLFGNITCMQSAIASRSIPFINTNCFNQVLNQQWYGQLDGHSIETVWGTCKFILHLASFGILAPVFLNYRSVDVSKEENEEVKTNSDDEAANRELQGINDHSSEKAGYVHKWIEFHRTPAVMISYQFSIYIWFLLVFSYMMLFHMKSPDESTHWTEIYVIITVSAALIEDIRKLVVEFRTQMLERWHISDSWIVVMYILPYVLFYIGIGLRFGSKNRPDLFTSARIILALDLEIWYLFSLRFVSAIKLLGPKLFMIRNMMRDLVGVIYIIFVCIAAYGVVSRALVMYSSIEFTANNIFASIFYQPYWFLYSIVDDEKNNLDDIIASNDSTSHQRAEATVNHILLAFHMLFVNILILSLLIAMFNFSINDVQSLNKYFWRYQRYELIREYFEKPTFAYPPLSLLIYIYLLVRLIKRRHTCFRIFKHLATPVLNTQWTDFENAATYEYARSVVEEKYRSPTKTETKSSSTHQEDGLTLELQVQMQQMVIDLQAQMKQIMVRTEWMMKAMDRVKMPLHRLHPDFPQTPLNEKHPAE